MSSIICEDRLEYMDVPGCPLCGTANMGACSLPILNYSFGSIDIPLPASGVAAIECANCGLIYKNVIPTECSLLRLISKRGAQVWRGRLLSYRKERRLLKEYAGSKNLSIMDVGSSDGGFLRAISDIAALRSALDVCCNKQCREIVNGEYIISSIEAPLIESSAKYDVVTAFDVLEHLYRPVMAVKNMRALLAPGGIILGETGSADGVECASGWWYTRFVEHHIFWNRRSLQALARLLNLQVVFYELDAHKGRRYMSWIKRLCTFGVHSTRGSETLRRCVREITSVSPEMVGNPYAKDHAIFILREP